MPPAVPSFPWDAEGTMIPWVVPALRDTRSRQKALKIRDWSVPLKK